MPAGLPGCKTQRVNAGTPRSTGAGSGPRGDLDWPDLTSPTLARSCVVWFDAYPSQQCAVVSWRLLAVQQGLWHTRFRGACTKPSSSSSGGCLAHSIQFCWIFMKPYQTLLYISFQGVLPVVLGCFILFIMQSLARQLSRECKSLFLCTCRFENPLKKTENLQSSL